MFKNKVAPYGANLRATMFAVHEGEEAAAIAAAALETATQARIDKAVLEATNGLSTKNTELLGKIKTANERTKLFEGLDPVELAAQKARLDSNDDAKLFAEGKGNTVIEKYTERMRAGHIDALAAKDLEIVEANKRTDAYRGSVLDNQIRAVTGGLHKGAVEDALLHARNIFSLDAKGIAVQLDAEGRAVLGKDGSTPFSLAEWIDLQKEVKQHWFPMQTSGSNTGATREASGTGKSISRANFEKLTPAEQGTQARSGIKITD